MQSSIEISKEEMFLGVREETSYAPIGGNVQPYNGYRLPSFLRNPLIQSESGGTKGIKSGLRSSLVLVEGKWYKKKGDAPVKDAVWESSGEPWGGMTESAALSELEAAENMHAKMKELGFLSVYVPAAIVRYNMRCGDRSIYSAIVEARGETRLAALIWRFMQDNLNGVAMGGDIREELSRQIASWMGFTHRLIAEIGAIPRAAESYGPANYVLHRVDSKGFGVSRVDFSSTSRGPELKDAAAFMRREGLDALKAVHTPMFVPSEALILNGVSLSRVARAIETGTHINLGSWSGQFARNVREGFEEEYIRAFEGRETPEPIGAAFLRKLFRETSPITEEYKTYKSKESGHLEVHRIGNEFGNSVPTVHHLTGGPGDGN